MTITEMMFDEWVRFNFDRPVTQPQWYFEMNADYWEGPAAVSVRYCTQLFENAEDVLAPYSNAQVNQGFWFLINEADGEIRAILDETVPLDDRVRCVRSINTLFAQCFLPRCSGRFQGMDGSANPLDMVVYMWWDIFPLWGGAWPGVQNVQENASDEVRALLTPLLTPLLPLLSDLPVPPAEAMNTLNGELLDVMRRTLELPSDTCRQSALHGLGHWEMSHPEQVRAIIDDFLTNNSALSPELREYALLARRGRVQ